MLTGAPVQSRQSARRRSGRGRAARAACCALLVGVTCAATASAAGAAPGDLDTGFATAGVFTEPIMTTFPGAEDSHTVAVDSLGRVYLSATQEPQIGGGPLRHVVVVRLSALGVPDPTFGTGGSMTLPTAGDVRNVGIVVDAQDRPIILTNNGENAATWRIGLTRLTTVGEPDTTFGGDGVVESALPGTSWNPWPAGIALDSNGGILVVGTLIACVGGSNCVRNAGFVARFGVGGGIDTTYGTDGSTAISDTGTEMAAIHPLPAGGAVVAGYDSYAEWVVARLTSGGALDASFDGDGLARSSLGKQPLDLVTSYGVTVDLQGRPVVVGQLTLQSGNAVVAVARWTSGGAPDAGFGTGTPASGVVLLSAAGGRAVDVAAQCTDGKLLIAASGSRPSMLDNRMTLTRLGDAGTLDPLFAPAAATPGVASMTAGDNNTASDLLLVPGGAYVTGFRRQNDGGVFTDYPQVARFVADEGCATGPPPAEEDDPPAEEGDPPSSPSPPSPPSPPGGNSETPPPPVLVVPASPTVVPEPKGTLVIDTPAQADKVIKKIKAPSKKTRLVCKKGTKKTKVKNRPSCKKVIVTTTITLRLAADFTFGFDSFALTANGKKVLARLDARLRTVEVISASVAGNASYEGRPDLDGYNKTLSGNRAKAAARALAKGLGHAKVRRIANGVTKPIKTNATPAGRAANRNVQLTFVVARK